MENPIDFLRRRIRANWCELAQGLDADIALECLQQIYRDRQELRRIAKDGEKRD
jgi:hypothetical protein